MTTIYLIRHAEAEGNRYRRAHGWYNSTITDRGYHQIAALAKRFADTKFDAVYSSDRFRTMITALAIYKTHGLPLRTVRALREIDVDGKPFRGALVEHLRTGVRTCYEVDEQTTYWTLWNNGGQVPYCCPEPQTWTTNAPNAADPAAEGFRAIDPGESWRTTFRLYAK